MSRNCVEPQLRVRVDYIFERSTDLTTWINSTAWTRETQVRLDPDGLETVTVVCEVPPGTSLDHYYWRLSAVLLPVAHHP